MRCANTDRPLGPWRRLVGTGPSAPTNIAGLLVTAAALLLPLGFLLTGSRWIEFMWLWSAVVMGAFGYMAGVAGRPAARPDRRPRRH